MTPACLEISPASLLAAEPDIPVLVDEFWTSRQRAAHSLHEISYRACFKPQLPRYFIERLSMPGDRVFDPFMGRGTTLIEAALLGRVPLGTDANPLCTHLVRPRLSPPSLDEVKARLDEIDCPVAIETPSELSVFYQRETLEEICALRSYLMRRQAAHTLDTVDDWIRMVALNRLTGHSPGFFSVYTMPPNQAVSIAAQIKINARLGQQPTRRDVPKLILKKTAALLKDWSSENRQTLASVGPQAMVLPRCGDAVPEIESESVTLVVTSPPFLDAVDYAADNWLRAWFAGVDANRDQFPIFKSLQTWVHAMSDVMRECRRVLRCGGHLVFEVGEVRKGSVLLERHALEAGRRAGLRPVQVMINSQQFTKTSNCWGVTNGTKGTNSNRIVVFQKP